MNFTGLPLALDRIPAIVITLLRRCLEPKLPPTATGTIENLFGSTLSVPANGIAE